MSNQIPADLHPDDVALARDFADEYRDSEYAPDRTVAVARVLAALLPAPPRPTLADMAEEERAACQWMQADVKGMKGRRVIAYPGDGGEMTQIMLPNGLVVDIDPENVTPRPDLPRWEWPGDKKAAPAPALPEGWRFADHKDNGRVMVTNTTPDEDGRVYYVLPAADPLGYDWLFCTPDELTYIDADQ